MGTSARPGAGYFPLMLSVIMAILGAIVMFKALTIETEGGDPVGSIAWKPLIVIVVSIAVFGFALPKLGMFVTIPLLKLSEDGVSSMSVCTSFHEVPFTLLYAVAAAVIGVPCRSGRD